MTTIKVFYLNDFHRDKPIAGETDGKFVEGARARSRQYLKIIKADGSTTLIHHAFVWHDTPTNRKLLEEHQKAWTAWKLAEPNMYDALNQMMRIRRALR